MSLEVCATFAAVCGLRKFQGFLSTVVEVVVFVVVELVEVAFLAVVRLPFSSVLIPIPFDSVHVRMAGASEYPRVPVALQPLIDASSFQVPETATSLIDFPIHCVQFAFFALTGMRSSSVNVVLVVGVVAVLAIVGVVVATKVAIDSVRLADVSVAIVVVPLVVGDACVDCVAATLNKPLQSACRPPAGHHLVMGAAKPAGHHRPCISVMSFMSVLPLLSPSC